VARSGEYGFIELPNGGAVFIHVRALLNGHALEVGAQVTFRLVETERGLRAVDAELIGVAEDCAQAGCGASAGGG
jgi:cold shock CspA family protein